ncbi:hypothetical protein Golax_014597, partial [Gossypium laxum]|nr:hypothetical protein [Gossypium laxum]
MTKGDLVNERREEIFEWSSPSHGWVKINVDGSTSMIDNWSAVGGVIRNSLGNWKESLGNNWVVECLTDRSGDNHSMTLVRKIITVKRCFQMVKFQFIPRKGNKVEDWINKTCPRGDFELTIIDFPKF